jgi:hypothetical protein
MNTRARAGRVGFVACLAVIAATALPTSAGAFVYWPHWNNLGFDRGEMPGAIGRANLDGSAVNKRFVTDIFACGVAVDGAHIYWGGGSNRPSSIGRAELDGSAVKQRFITDVGQTCGVAVDGTHIYWASESSPEPQPNFEFIPSTIGRANLNGSAVNRSFIPVSQLISSPALPATGACGVAVDGTHIYWANGDFGTIGRANLDGTAVNQSFIAGAADPCGVAVDGAHVYWANHSGNSIGRANLDGSGMSQTFITGAAGPYGVAVDGAHLFWANARGNTIGRANLDGSAVNQRFITSAGGPMGVAVDGRRPSNSFTLAKPRLNRRTGTATLVATVPEPGKLALTGRAVKKQRRKVRSAGRVKLLVKATKGAAKRLRRTGRAKLTARVTYTPLGGGPRTKRRKLVLEERGPGP